MDLINSSYKNFLSFNNECFASKSGKLNNNFDETLQSEILNDTDSRGLIDVDINDEETNETYLSIILANSHLGASYYDSNRQTIFHLDDIQESNKFEIISLLILDLKPLCVIVSAKTDEVLIKFLKENIDENRILLVANNDYNYEYGKKRIMQLKLNHILKLNLTDDSDKYIYFSSFLNFESHLLIRSIGALLKYLDKNRIGVQLEEMAIQTPIVAFKSIKLDDVLLIDQNSLNALQVFHSVSHPSAYKQNSKEGLSLFNIYFKQIQTKLGVLKLRSWLLKPTRNENILSKRHEIIEFFMDPCNQDYTQRVSSMIRNCKNMNLVFKRLKMSQPSVNDWISLFKTTENMIKLITICDQLTNNQQKTTSIIATTLSCTTHETTKLSENNLFEKFADTYNIDYFKILNDIFNLLLKIIDFRKMAECKHFCVLPNIDEDLDNKRNLRSTLAENLTKIAEKESERLKICECNVLFISQLGFLLVISQKKLHENPVDRSKFEFDSELTLVFCDEEKYFYKNKLMHYLDNKFGDLETEINNIQRKIIYELQTAISDYNYVYAYLIDLCSELDVCLAFSKVAIEYNYVKPIFDKDKTCFIYARQTRHPLLQLVVDSFVPNDVLSGLIPNLENQHELIDETNSIKVLTGPNGSGKSIYMKQVGLLIYMSYIGSFVAADYAFIGDFDRIYTRLNSNDSVSLSMSTFSIDVKQISEAINNYTNKSLILIDEFGKGTQSNDGSALFASVVRYFLLRGSSFLPHVLISTHFHDVLSKNLFKIDNKRDLVDYLTFDYIMETNENNEKNIVQLYTLKKSITRLSYAIDITQKIGVNINIVQRAQQILEIKRKAKNFHSLQTEETLNQFNDRKNFVKSFLEICNDDSESELEDNKSKSKTNASIFRDFLKNIKEFDESRHEITVTDISKIDQN